MNATSTWRSTTTCAKWFVKRAKIMQSIREYLIEKGFIEVETPTLQPIYGGANAKLFTTHHNAANMTLYLRVAPELYLKRCIVGGYGKGVRVQQNFRNEGMDRTHSPEFTCLEFTRPSLITTI